MSADEKAFLTIRDKQAIAAYENHCKGQKVAPSEAGRMQWVNEWRVLDSEHNESGLEVERAQRLDADKKPAIERHHRRGR